MSLTGVIAAQTGYQSNFEALTASATGTPMAGQDGFYVPAVAGSIDGAMYTYTGNTLGVPANPNGGNNFWAGASQGGTAFARSQRAVTLPTGLVKISYDICCGYNGAAVTPTNNIGSFSFQPSTNALYVNLVAAYPTGVTYPPTTWDANVVTRGVVPGTVTTVLPNPAFQGLAMNVWHTWSCTVNMATGEHVDFSIKNGVTGITTTYKPSTPLLMPVAPALPGAVPTDFRLFGGGGLGNIFAIDNLDIVDGAAVADAVGEGCPFAHSFYENFATAPAFDLAGRAITMTPTGGGGYAVTSGGAYIPVGSIGTPVTLALTDDSQATHTLTVGTFPGWTALTVCSNGFVSQATGNGTGFTPSATTMLGNPQTGFYSWHDFNPAIAGSGQVKVEESATVTTVTWDGVFSFGTTSGAHNMQFQFYPSGQVTIAYGSMAGNGNGYVVGYSPGGASANPGSSDLSGLGAITLTAPGVNKAPLRLAAGSRPVQGAAPAAFTVTTSNIPAGAGIHLGLIGFSNSNLPLIGVGMPDCTLYSSAEVIDAAIITGSTQNWTPLTLPALPGSFSGFTFYLQSAILGTTENTAFGFGALTSNGVRCIVGLN